MELTLEAYALIAKLVGGRADLCSLCRVSKTSQLAAERALYNTINLADPETACVLFNLFAEQPRVSPLVVALSISLEDDDEASNGTPLVLPSDYWQVVSRGLQHLPYLRFLHIYIDDGSDPHNAWCLNSCHFQLQTFHCDLSWDASLVTFLSKQNEITDLYIADFNEDTPENVLLVPHSLRGARSLPTLRNVECTFTEAVGALVPGRPVTRVKTCFSRSDIAEKRAEMAILIANLHLSTQSLLSINVADSSYTSAFSLEFLRSLVDAISPDAALRYLGVLAFPVDSKEVGFHIFCRSFPARIALPFRHNLYSGSSDSFF